MKNDIIINILSKFIKRSIDIDDKLYKRAIEKKYNGERIGRSEFYKNGNVSRENHRNYSLQARQYTNLDLYGSVSIELDTFEKKRLENSKR